MVISIDIGTSYSSICYRNEKGEAEAIDISTGQSVFGSKHSLPSSVFAEDGGQVLVGQAAMNARKRKPSNFVMEFKRHLGEEFPIILGEKSFLPENLYTKIFLHMQECRLKISDESLEKIYITYPATFSTKKKNLILNSAKDAGMFNVSLVDEPTAAAMCYHAKGHLKDGQTVLIYDFGGGTFDVSLVECKGGEFNVLGTGGIERLGGSDIDRIIFADMLEQVNKNMGEDFMEQLEKNPEHELKFESQLSEIAVKAKHDLSSAEKFEEYVVCGFDGFNYEITREKLNKKISLLVSNTIMACNDVLMKSGKRTEDLSAVFLVGGTSRIPLVQDMVRKFVNPVHTEQEQAGNILPVRTVLDLELAVVQGAINYYDLKEKDEQNEWYEKAEAYYYGKGVIKDYQAAVMWYEKAAKKGNADAQYSLGHCKKNGQGTQKDYHNAVFWFEKSAEQGHAGAQCSLGVCYQQGQGVSQNYALAVSWYEKAAAQNHARAQYNLGVCYHNGQGVIKDRAKGIGLFKLAAAQGEENAIAALKREYEKDELLKNRQREEFERVERERRQAEEKIRMERERKQAEEKTRMEREHKQTEEKGRAAFAQNCFNMGCSYYFGQDGKTVDYTEAVKWFKKGAEQGDAKSQYNLGLCYEHGRGIAKDAKKAAKWFKKGAEQGESSAQYNLGVCYDNGTGVPQDYIEAVKWYRKSADQGNTNAQNNLAACYINGQGVERDYKEAVRWFEKAARQGQAMAQHGLGMCYKNGHGVEKNKKEAKKWMQLAAERGNEMAIKDLKSSFRW